MRLLVDACNFLFRHPGMADLPEERSFAEAREALCVLFARYRGAKGAEVTLVFDGSSAGAHHPRVQSRHGVRMVFSDAEEGADGAILEMLDGTHRPAECTVVTSDRALAAGARVRGARAMACEELRRQIEAAFRREKDPFDGESPQKMRPTMTRGDIEMWMRYFGIE